MKETMKSLLARFRRDWQHTDPWLKRWLWICVGILCLPLLLLLVFLAKEVVGGFNYFTRPVGIFETQAARDCLDVYRVTQYESTATMEDAEARRWVARCLTAGGIKR
jgi:hypothetical protein